MPNKFPNIKVVQEETTRSHAASLQRLSLQRFFMNRLDLYTKTELAPYSISTFISHVSRTIFAIVNIIAI